MTYSLLNSKKRWAFAMLLSLMTTIGFSQDKYKPAAESFESEKALSFFKVSNGKLTLSDAHKRYGKTSLQWNWTGNSTFGTSNFKILSSQESPLKYGDHFPASPTLQMSIYNETPKKEKITISFEKEGVKKVWFDIELSFTGWRRLWVPFFEMQGDSPEKGVQVDYDYFRVSTSIASGKLFFDDIVFSQYQDNRHPYPDEIVPFIKADKNLGDDHWMPLTSNYDRIKNFKAKPVSAAVLTDLKKIEELINQDLTSVKKNKEQISKLRDIYQSLNLKDNGETILGPPLTFGKEEEYFDKKAPGHRIANELGDFGKILKKMSIFYNREDLTEKKEIEAMFLTSTRYFLDQGWQAGSNGGTRHHIGYSMREITEAFFTMRHVLEANGLLVEVGKSLHWLFNLGVLLDDESTFHVNIDYLNTQSYYHLMLIFMFDNPEMQAELLRAYSNFLSITLAQQNEEWGFKIDGTTWHHNGHYPAYASGAFKEVPKLIKMLSGTQFRIGTEGHRNFKNAFLASRTYSQLYDWGFGNAGRHPLGNGGIQSLKKQFLEMAYAGNPEGTANIDKDVAAAYLRLWGNEDPLNSSIFTKVNGIQAENLSGYYAFPFAATTVHRRDDWAAIIKGYSKYVWASEIYVAENRYGRYPANGTVQLLNEGGEQGSGFRQDGWDWNRYPGATIIYLPLEELEPQTPLIMFRSEESFAGATTLNGNGVFGMVLNEAKGSNAEGPAVKVGFPGRLKAKKSVFSYGDKLIFIGTDISSIDEKNPTQTNLFQTFLKNTGASIATSSETINKFPHETVLKQTSNSGPWLIDPYGNGYHVLSNTPIHIKKAKQQSYHNKYSVNTGSMNKKGKGVTETEGDFATAWIDHGLAPKNASYQYVVYPFLNEENQKNFGNRVNNDKSFTILRADSIAHIVADKETNTTGYVIFEANKSLENGTLKQVSEPALLMIHHKDQNSVVISAVQPDLNFPINDKGKFKNYSDPVNLTITLEGKWNAFPAEFITKINYSGDDTIITLNCISGLPREFTLNKQ
ncbi:chondroitinase family polysaccharide lyase [Mariniflexile ostreae]|uniref:Chondroitinase family polysaccharide lyase n=1 Tax=Mariniflexile ostreae TaxID=1520892 RepID=A0ABV5FG99_9FLAO